MKILTFLLIIILFASCAPRYQAQKVTQYKVESVEKKPFGATVKLEGVRGTWDVVTDTLKVGDIMPVSWIRRIR